MTNRMLLLLAVVLPPFSPVGLSGQQFNHVNDHVLNAKGRGRITLATGIPYVAIGEYAYGVSDRVTVGVLAGVLGKLTVKGYGIRARAVVHEPHDGFRIYFCTPVLFYPSTKGLLGGDPWWLARPNINFEWITERGFRYKVGGGLIAAASHHSLFGNPSEAKFVPDIWNSVHGGISFPIGTDVTFQVEASLIMNGFRVADDWVGGLPVLLVMGTSWSL